MIIGQEPAYQIHTSLSQRVNNLNPCWNDETTEEIITQRFMKAVELTGQEFIDNVHYFSKSWLLARELVIKAFQNRFEHDPNGRIMVLDRPVPWILHLFQIEEEFNAAGSVFYVIFKEETWRIRAVPITEFSFILRNALNKNWRGLSGEELVKISNISGSIFVHSTGFIGGNKTLEGAIEMAKKSIENI